MGKCEGFEFLFVDIEWNQKVGTEDISGREPIQIGLIGTDTNLENVKLFSKSIRLADVNTLTEKTCKLTHVNANVVMQGNTEAEVFEKVNMTFEKYKYVVVWTYATYELFARAMDNSGIKMPRHKILILQDILSRITLPSGRNLGFENALIKAEIPYEKNYLHYSKHDVKYMYELFKKMYASYQELTKNEPSAVNETSGIIHSPDCRYLKKSKVGISTNSKILIFRGYRPCSCCGSEVVWRKLFWKVSPKKKNSEKQDVKKRSRKLHFRDLPLTDDNILLICNQFDMKCNIGERIVFITTNCGYWRIYLDDENVTEVFHGNYRMTSQDFKKKKKCNEGFHKQDVSVSNFYEVVRYIHHHDKNVYKNAKKSRVEMLLEKIEKEMVVNGINAESDDYEF